MRRVLAQANNVRVSLIRRERKRYKQGRCVKWGWQWGGVNVRVTYRGEWKRGPSTDEEDKMQYDVSGG